MSDNDMFQETTNTEQPKQTETPSSTSTDPFADKLSVIKNEQGQPKYKDVDTALEALAASQQFIEQLKAEKAEEKRLREEREAELVKMGGIDEFVKKLNPSTQTENKVETPQTSTGLSEEKVAELLEQKLAAREQESRGMTNLQEVTSKLSEVHGDKSSAFIQQRAKELGTTVTELKQLAMTNPRMALAALGEGKTSTPTPTQTSMNLPFKPSEENKPPQFERGTTRGGLTSKEVAERFAQSKAYTNKRLGVTE